MVINWGTNDMRELSLHDNCLTFWNTFLLFILYVLKMHLPKLSLQTHFRSWWKEKRVTLNKLFVELARQNSCVVITETRVSGILLGPAWTCHLHQVYLQKPGGGGVVSNTLCLWKSAHWNNFNSVAVLKVAPDPFLTLNC